MKRLEEMNKAELKELISSKKFRLKTQEELLREGWKSERGYDHLENRAYQFNIDKHVFDPDFELRSSDIEEVDHSDESFRVSCLDDYEWLPLSIIVPTSGSTLDSEEELLL